MRIFFCRCKRPAALKENIASFAWSELPENCFIEGEEAWRDKLCTLNALDRKST